MQVKELKHQDAKTSRYTSAGVFADVNPDAPAEVTSDTPADVQVYLQM